MPPTCEQVGKATLITDEALFTHFIEMYPSWTKSASLGLVPEVRSNKDRDVPNEEHARYASKFLDDVEIVRLPFYEGAHKLVIKDDTLKIGLRYAALWIIKRINWMEQNIELSKEASWTWSENYLPDFLSFKKLGLLTV